MARTKVYKYEKRKHGKGGNKSKSQQNNGSGKAKQNGGSAFKPHGDSYTEAQRLGRFSFDTIHGLKLKEVSYTVPSLQERKARRAEFHGEVDPTTGEVIKEGIRSKFLKMLANEHKKELIENLGLTSTDLDGMAKGYTPNGFNVHHKLALHGGGKNEFKNFILTPIYPHDQWHYDVMDPQIAGMRQGETRKIMIPDCDEMVYDPKKYGFFKENVPVAVGYRSCVNPSNYEKLYLPEHINVEKRNKDMAAFYASIEEKNKAQAAALAAKQSRGGR